MYRYEVVCEDKDPVAGRVDLLGHRWEGLGKATVVGEMRGRGGSQRLGGCQAA